MSSHDHTTYVVATATAPRIVCPWWCAVPEADHAADLEELEGYVSHDSGERGGTVALSVRTLADGTPDPTEPDPSVLVVGMGRLSVTEARALGRELLQAAEDAGSGPWKSAPASRSERF